MHVVPANLNYSQSDGDLGFDRPPDIRWLVASYSPRGYYLYTDIGVAPADGSLPPRDISLNGYSDESPVWHSGGDLIYWHSDRYGDRTDSSSGAEADVLGAFLNETDWRLFRLTEQERELPTASEAGDDADESDDAKETATAADVRALLNLSPARGEGVPVAFDL